MKLLVLLAVLVIEVRAAICSDLVSDVRTYKPLVIDCPTEGGGPKIASISFNYGKAGQIMFQENSALKVLMAASLDVTGEKGTSGLVVDMDSRKSLATTPPGSFIGTYGNRLCSDLSSNENKVCEQVTLTAGPYSTTTRYLNVWNTGGCTEGSKLLIEASIEQVFGTGQDAKCTSALVEVGLPRPFFGNGDDLYCNVGTASTCSGQYDEVYCGKISDGYKCVRSETKTSTQNMAFGIKKTCTSGSLSCQDEDFECPEEDTSNTQPCRTCDSNDCFSKSVLRAVDSGDISKIAISILGVAATFIFA